MKTLITLVLFCTPLFAEPIAYDHERYSDENVAELITVITATSPVLSIPNTTHIYPAQVSLYRNPVLAKAKKIIVFDAVPAENSHLEHAYDKYKANIQELTQSDYYFQNTELIFCTEWGHLSGAITEALKHVTTPFVFMHQHDLILQKNFDLNGLIATMQDNLSVKYVHLWGAKNKKSEWWNRIVDDKIEGVHYVPLTRCFGWSDQCHVATVDYYKNFVLPQCDHCFMEHVMQRQLEKQLDTQGEVCHQEFGTFLFGELSDGYYIKHTDGRRTL